MKHTIPKPSLLGKINVVRQAFAEELQEAIDLIPDYWTTKLIILRYRTKNAGIYGRYDTSIKKKLKQLFYPAGKREREAQRQTYLKDYNAVEFKIASETFYANIDHADAILSLFRELHEIPNNA